jgi:hypothetical protein
MVNNSTYNFFFFRKIELIMSVDRREGKVHMCISYGCLHVRNQELDFQCYMSWSFFMLKDLRFEMIVRFLDIGGIIDHHCLTNSIFINSFNIFNSWSYWIYNYLCNQCLSPLTLWVWIPLIEMYSLYNIMSSCLSVTRDRSVIFCGYSGFLHQ